MRGTIASITCVLVAIAFATPAFADQTSDEARKHFEAGTAAFNLGEFKTAVDEYKAAYKLRSDPVFLYNIAQAYRMGNDLEQALFFYRSYLHNAPNAPNLDEVSERIRVLEEQHKKVAQPPNTPRPPEQQQTEQTATPPPEQTTTTREQQQPPPPATSTARAEGSPKLRLAGVITGSVGVAALVAGIAVFVVGRGDASDLVDAKPNTVFSPSDERNAHALQPAGVALMITGGVLAVGGTTLFLLGRRHAERSATAARDGGAL